MRIFPTSLLPTVLFLCFLLGTAGQALCQDKDWRPITPEELQMKSPKVDPDADAEAIFWEVRIDDSSSDDLSRKYYVRVKIFTERGREKYSKVDIPFLKGTKIKDIAARVIRPDGSIVEIGKNDIFEREIAKADNVKVKAKSFAVPNIEPGVIVEYRYKETNDDSGAVGLSLQFQRDIPVHDLSYYYKPYEGEPRYQSYNFTGVKFNKDKGGYFLAQRRDVPALKEESMMPPEDNVRAWMLLTGTRFGIASASMFGISYTIKDPSNPVLYWGGVAGEWSPLAQFMLKKSDDIKKAAEAATAGVPDAEAKMKKLYEFCQTEIANTTFDTKMTDEQRAKLPAVRSLNEVLKRKSSSSMYIDLLFGAMASSLGFDTRIALIGDRSKINFNPEKMVNDKLVHPGGIAVKVNDTWKFFNPGSRFVPYGMMPWYEEGTMSLLVGEKTYNWKESPLSDETKTQAKRTGKFNLLEDGTLEGEVIIEYTGHDALIYRLQNYDESSATREDGVKSEVKSDLSAAEVSEVIVENVDDPAKPLIKRFKVRVPNYAQKTGKRIFFQPGFFEYGEKPLFSSSTRQYDIFFRYPWSEVDNIEITYPKNFDLDNADLPQIVEDPSKICSDVIEISVDRANSILVYKRKFHFGAKGKILFPSTVYQPLKNLFDMVNKSDSHTITLKQK